MDAGFERAASRRALLWLIALKIVLVVLVFDPRGSVAFDLPKSLASRALEWAIVAVLVFALVMYGRGIVPRTRLHAFVAAVVLISVAAALFAAEPYVAIFGEQDRYLGLTFLADMVVLYIAVAVAVRDLRDGVMLLGAVVLAGTVAGGYAIVQVLGADPFAWAADPRSRPFATFGNPDTLGHFISVLFGVAFGALIGASGPTRRLIAGAGMAAALTVAAFVATRGTLVGIAGALLGAAIIVRPGRRAALAGLAAAVAIAGVLLMTPLGQRAIATVSGGAPDRLAIYGIAARATFARPLLGWGPDNFRAAFVTHRTVESLAILGSGPETSAHDWVLDAAATNGLLGLAALIVLVAVGTTELIALARTTPVIGLPLAIGWSAYWANALVDVGSVSLGWYPWLALGVAAALRGTRRDAVARRVPPWLGPAIAIAAMVGMATGARAFIANDEAWSSADALHAGDAEAALTFADRAAARDGGRADHWNKLGLAFEAERRWTNAAEAYRAAASRERYEPVYWVNLGRALARTGAAAQDDAIGAATEATAVDPSSPIGHSALAEIAVTFGRCDLARAEAALTARLEAGHDDLVARAAACR